MKKVNKLAVYALLAPALTVGASSVYAQTTHSTAEDSALEQRTTQDRAGERNAAGDSLYSESANQSSEAHSGQRESGIYQRHTDEQGASSATANRSEMNRPGSNKMGRTGMKGQQLSAAPSGAFHAEWLLDQEVRTQGDDETAGTINDIVIDENGQVLAVIVGIGGVLGLGERSVAIAWDELQRTSNSEGDTEFTTSMSQDALRDAPDYDRGDNDSMGNDSMESEQQTEPYSSN